MLNAGTYLYRFKIAGQKYVNLAQIITINFDQNEIQGFFNILVVNLQASTSTYTVHTILLL